MKNEDREYYAGEEPTFVLEDEEEIVKESKEEKPDCFKNFGLGKAGNAEKIINYIIWGDENRRDFRLDDGSKSF